MKIKLVLATILAFSGAFLFTPNLSFAAIRCETQYGGGQTCVKTGNIQVNKQVKEITGNDTHEWRDNLVHVTSDKFFKPQDLVEYRIKVKNVGDVDFATVILTDTLPSQLELVEGSLSQELKNLKVNEEREIFIKAKVKNADQLGNSNTNCDIANTAKAVSGDQSDQDTAKVCVQKFPETAKALPKAGPEDFYLILGLSILASTLGFFVYKLNEKRI